MPTYLSVGEKGRSRSKSPGGGRERDRSHSRDTRRKSPPRESKKSSKKYESSSSESEDDRRSKKSSKKYYESESEDDRRRSKKSSKKYNESESEDSDTHRRSSKSKKYYESDSDDRKHSKKPTRRRSESESESDKHTSKSKKSSSSTKKKAGKSESDSGSEDINISIHRKSKSKPEEPKNGQYGYAQPAPYAYAPPGQYIADPRVAYQTTRHGSYIDPQLVAVSQYPTGHTDRPGVGRTHSVSVPQYDQRANPGFITGRDRDPAKQYIKTYNDRGEAQYIEIKPEAKPEKKKYHDDKYGSSPEVKKMEYLALGGGLGASLTVAGQSSRRASDAGQKPPASPLLEAYRGTYQSMSPMPPSALILRNHKNDSDLSDFDLSESDSESDIDPRDPNADIKLKIRKLEREKRRHEEQKRREEKKHLTEEKKIIDTRNGGRGKSDVSITTIEPDYAKKGRKTVIFYDPEPDAKRIAAALAGTHKVPQIKPLIEILPGLTSDDLFALRTEYKKHAKTAGQGINIAKHIKTRVPGNIGKVAYATALGRWESEAFWANSWYQGGASRRELLIESLMGRSNSDIREIKNCFKDKRYGDDLEKCMKAELKADKFRIAILLALEEKRMPDGMGLDVALIRSDVQRLYKALVAPSGGETEMIEIIVLRSDAHLREVLKFFEVQYNRNFARDMIERSKNLVGETLAHILNGALNRPMRDALLLHQAISETAPGKERAELLISRLVRLHWEPKHLERVKAQYEARYKVPIESAIKKDVVNLVKSEEARQWGEFCIELAKSSSNAR